MTAAEVGTPYSADRSLLGDSSARALLPVQALNSAGEALFALSLVGSLFFSVSVDAARPRILLYLALTMAPFVVLAPLIGPIIDRLKGGHRVVLLLSIGGRSIVALLLATQLKTLLLYPQAFVIIVLAKVFMVGRNALIPSLVEDREHLVVVNSRLARVGAIAAAVAALLGLVILQFADAAWVLRAAAVFHMVGAIGTLRIPGPKVEANASPIIESTEMHGPGIQFATIGMSGIRMATGFVLFHVGFALKTSGQPTWVVGGVLAASAFGGFSGTFLAPRLHRRWDEQRVLTGAVVLLGLFAAVAALRFHGATAFALALSVGLAGSLGRRAFDGVVQTEAPHTRRGRAYAALETRLELAWVVGSFVAVIARLPNWVGLVMLSGGLALLGISRIATIGRASRVGDEVDKATLAPRLLETAEAIAARGDRQQAILVALAAVEAADLVWSVDQERLQMLQRCCAEAVQTGELSMEELVLREATELVAESSKHLLTDQDLL